MTTIKVDPLLRDQINAEAQQLGTTAGGFIRRLLEAYQHQRRMTAFGNAFREADDTYYDDVALWDSTLSDGLDNA